LPKPEIDLQDAFTALSTGDLASARERVQRLTRSHPGWAPAVHLDGLVTKAEGDWSTAEDRFRQSLELPGVQGQVRAEYANNLGNLLREAGHPGAAEAAYRHGLQAFDLKRLRTGLAATLLELDRPDEALGLLLALRSEQFSEENDLLLLAGCLSSTGDPAGAYEALLPARASLPVSDERRLAIARCLIELRRDVECEAVLQPLLGGRHDGDARLALVELCMRRDDGQQALDLLTAGLARNPRNAALQRQKASIRWLTGDSAGFAADLERAVAAEPTDRDLRLALVDVLGNAGRHDAAEAALREAVRSQPGDPSIIALLARRLAETERAAEGRTWAERALALAPEAERVRESAAIAALAAGDAHEALRHTEWLVGQRPDGQFAWALRSTALRLAGDPRAAAIADPARVCRAARIMPAPEYGDLETFNRSLAERLRERHTAKAHPLVNSVRDGTQVQIHPLTETDPLVRALLGMFLQAVTQFVADMPTDPAHPLFSRKARKFRISGCWSVRLRGGAGRHVSHVHPQGWLSSAYYVTVPPEVTASAERRGWLSFGQPSFKVPGLGPVGWVRPLVGHLALFPSYQWHGVEPFPGDGERMTVAFDIVPVRV
jgi:predicted Zn-dependent protease